MPKSPTQEKLEAQRGKPIETVLHEALERHRGKKLLAALAGIDLGVSDATVYNWCNQLGIDIDDYRLKRAAHATRDRVLTETREGEAK